MQRVLRCFGIMRAFNLFYQTAISGRLVWQQRRHPTFFPPTNIHGRYYVEGGLGNNNPVRTCIDEALRIWGKKRLLGCVVSIGTGKAQMNDVGRGVYLLKSLRNIATSPDKAALEFRNEMLGAISKSISDFNGQGGLENVGLEELKETGRIQQATEFYMDEVREQVQSCAAMILELVGTSTEQI
jgi:predicted acylesterase/phospholipase RssA